MLTAEQIAQAIIPLMPAEHQAQAPVLARLLADLAEGARSPEEARAEVAESSALAQAVGALGGRQVTSSGAVLRFGEGSQLGDVSLRDVAGGNIVSISLPAQPPQRQQIDERRTYGCLGLPIFSITSSRTIITLALTIFFSGAILGGLVTKGLPWTSDSPPPTHGPVATAVAALDATALAATVAAVVQQTQQAMAGATTTAIGGNQTATVIAVGQAQTVTAEAVAELQTAVAMATPPPDLSQANPVIVPANTQLQSAGWLYNFSQPSYAVPLIGPVGQYQPTNGRFALVLIFLANTTGVSQAVPADFFVLKDAQGRVWAARPEVSDAYVISGVNADLSQTQTVPPDGLTRSVALIFDIAPNATNLVFFARSNPSQGWLVLSWV